jgi:hypothetical protein
MPCPKNVFIDTCIFDGQAYNFASSVFASFSEAAKGKQLTLLLPDPTEREIRKHIHSNALGALNDQKGFYRITFLSAGRYGRRRAGC